MLIAGGVASSRLFRELVTQRTAKRQPDLRVHFGRPEYSGDNAVGVALIGARKWREQQTLKEIWIWQHRILDGKAISAELRGAIAQRVARLREKGVTPGLAVILVGADPASQIYVRNKSVGCDQVRIHSVTINLPETTTQDELEKSRFSRLERGRHHPRYSGAAAPAETPR